MSLNRAFFVEEGTLLEQSNSRRALKAKAAAFVEPFLPKISADI